MSVLRVVLSVVLLSLLLFLCVSVFPVTVNASSRRVHENFDTIRQERYRLGIQKRPVASGNVVAYTITQPLDHFDAMNKGTYSQKYWINDQFWDGKGPAFLYLGGEWVEGPGTLEYGDIVISSWAKTFNGLMVNTQHRYYDGANPPSKVGDPTGLQYLSSQQAIADLANLVSYLNKVYAVNNTNIKWIHVGGSYGGNMAAWYRLKYPNLSVGGLAISGPVKAVVDYTGFFSVFGHDLTPACLNYTRTAVAELDTYLADEDAGWKTIARDFNITFNGTTQQDRRLARGQWLFLLSFDYLLGGAICRDTTGLTPYQSLAKTAGNSRGMQYITYTAANIYDMYSWLWFYQTCTEMGYYQTGSDFDTNPLQIAPGMSTPLVFKQACTDAYGVSGDAVDKNIDFTNVVYGGKGITTSNTFFTHGNADGWSAAGVTNGPVPVYGNTVMVIDKGSQY